MQKVVISLSGAKHFKLKGKFQHGKNLIEEFPDGEYHQKFSTNLNLKGKKVFIIQSFYKDEDYSVHDRIFETLSAYYNAKNLGAKKVYLISPYFCYLRQDKMFEKNQAITAKIVSKLFSIFDKVFIFEPHLHRIHSFKGFFSKAQKVSLHEFFIKEIKKLKLNPKRLLFIGPDIESKQWIDPVMKPFCNNCLILKKTRLSPRKVIIQKCDVEHDSVVLVDDILSTGKTLYGTVKQLSVCRNIYCFAYHPVFSDLETLKKIQKHSKVYTTNSLPIKTSRVKVIDISSKINELIQKN